MTVKI